VTEATLQLLYFVTLKPAIHSSLPKTLGLPRGFWHFIGDLGRPRWSLAVPDGLQQRCHADGSVGPPTVIRLAPPCTVTFLMCN